jgi:hypothetical protein
MIYLEMAGRYGNKLFRYSFARRLSIITFFWECSKYKPTLFIIEPIIK